MHRPASIALRALGPCRTALLLGGVLLAVGPSCAAEADAAEEPRMIVKEIVVAAPREALWRAWTTEEGLRFVSAVSRVELRPGGAYEWFLDLEPDAQGRRGGEGARILAVDPGRRLEFTWTFPPSIPSLREAGETTRAVVSFEDAADGATRVRFVQDGWREGEDWDAGYAYFDKAWSYVLDRLKATLEGDGD